MLIPFKELFSRHNIHAKGVLHCGSSWGQEADAYASLGISRVIWVEALPDVYRKLVENVARYPEHVPLWACLSDTDGDVVNFNVADNGGQSSSFLEFGTHRQAHPGVHFVKSMEMVTTRLDTLLQQNDVVLGTGWFLNVDVQGAELKVLKGIGELLRCFEHAYVEVNLDHLYKGCPLIGEIDAYMDGFGFVRKETKMTKQGWGDACYGK